MNAATPSQSISATRPSAEELQALTERIIASGALGRSKIYAAILRYLVNCSLAGESPKETAIAIDILGREADFDVTRDSIVRVHIYNLRNKLKAYYLRHGRQEKYRLDIPKGQYIVTAFRNQDDQPPQAAPKPAHPYWKHPTAWAIALLTLPLLLLSFLIGRNLADLPPAMESGIDAAVQNPLAAMSPWLLLMEDQRPILLVIGDYYIFAELDETGRIARMVREFAVNSPADLELFQNRYPQQGQGYMDLDLSYIPVGSAFALRRIMPILHGVGERIAVKMASELDTADLASSHIIYLGYLSAMGSLLDLLLADSDLAVGATFDELINLETGARYVSSSGLSIGEHSFQDYGLLSVFPAPNGNQFIIIAGLRDEGLVNVSQQVASKAGLQTLAASFSGAPQQSYEALYEVYGFDNTNFSSELVHAKPLDTRLIWEIRLMP